MIPNSCGDFSDLFVLGDDLIDMVQLVQDAVKDSNVSAKTSSQSQLSAAEKRRVLQLSSYDVDDNDGDNNLYPLCTVPEFDHCSSLRAVCACVYVYVLLE